MTAIGRRGLLVGTTAFVTALALPGRLAASPVRPRLFIADSRIAAGASAARLWRSTGVRLIDRADEDLGQAWYSLIPTMLKDGPVPIAGLTLWVDSYICETFGRELGLVMERATVAPGEMLHGWMLAPAGYDRTSGLA